MNVLQVNSKLVTTAYSQPMNLVQTEPKLTVQIAKTAFVIIPTAEEINRAILPLLKHRPTSTGCFLITEHFKFAQTIRIDFIHSTDLVTGLVDFSAVLVNWKRNDNPIIILFCFYMPFIQIRANFLCLEPVMKHVVFDKFSLQVNLGDESGDV